MALPILPAAPGQPEWRNWQTRGIQNPVDFGPCGFEPHLRHHSPVSCAEPPALDFPDLLAVRSDCANLEFGRRHPEQTSFHDR